MRRRVVAGVLSALLALFGLGGCEKTSGDPPEMPEILDGPGMCFDPATQFTADVWVDVESGQVLSFQPETLILKQDEQVLWEGGWEVSVEEPGYVARSVDGELIGMYEYFVYHGVELLEDGSAVLEYLTGYPADRADDESFVRFEGQSHLR